jgi:hypothetical protein
MDTELRVIWHDVLAAIVDAEEGRVTAMTAEARYEFGVDYLANEYEIEDGELIEALEYMDYENGVFAKDLDDVLDALG